MDLRTERTERNIINAFIELRAKKPIEKITIKDLTTLADMNKATFYRHYADIYDLSNKLENELINECLNEMWDTDLFFTNDGISRMITIFTSKSKLFDILFSDSRRDMFVHKLHTRLCEIIFEKHPEIKADKEKAILLSVTIYGSFHGFLTHRDEDIEVLCRSLSKAAKLLAKKIFEFYEGSLKCLQIFNLINYK